MAKTKEIGIKKIGLFLSCPGVLAFAHHSSRAKVIVPKRVPQQIGEHAGWQPAGREGGPGWASLVCPKHTIIFLNIERVDVVRVDEAVGAAQGNNGGITTEHCRGKECQNTKGREWRSYSMHPAVEH